MSMPHANTNLLITLVLAAVITSIVMGVARAVLPISATKYLA